MKKELPEKVSQEKIVFDVRELEPLLSPPSMDFTPFKPAFIELNNGQRMLIRSAKKEEAPLLLSYVKKFLDEDHDFYDIVGARIYAEILGWMRNRLKDPYHLVGLIDGEWVGLANGRLFNEDINISLHTMAFKRGLKIGAILYYAKCEYAFETLNQKEFWATYESYNGLKRWGIGMAQPSYPWPDQQHELGGAKVFYITRKYWHSTIKKYLLDMIGNTIERPVPQELTAKNESLSILQEVGI